MNSKQRRTDKRFYKYNVRTRGFYYDARYQKYIEMWDWCVKNFGNRGKWREKFGHPGDCWQFSDPKHAAWFRLKWSDEILE